MGSNELENGSPNADESRLVGSDCPEREAVSSGPDNETSDTSKTPAGKSNGNRKKALRIATAAFLFVVLGSALWWLHARHYETTSDAFIDAQVVRISPQVAGIVSELPTRPNQHVTPGQLLVAIAPDTVLPEIAKQQAGVVQAQAQAASARSGIASAQASRTAAAASAAAARAQMEKAEQDLARLENLKKIDPGDVSQAQLDAAQAAAATARAQYSAGSESAREAEANLASARQQASSANAATRSAQASAESGQVSLDKTHITAPMAGYIADISINRGSYVAPGLQMMALVPDDLWITANFKETQLAKIHVGDPVSIKIDAYPNRHFSGRVDSIQRATGQEFQLFPPQNATGNFVKVVQRVPVRIVFTQPLPGDLAFGPGMSVTPTVKIR